MTAAAQRRIAEPNLEPRRIVRPSIRVSRDRATTGAQGRWTSTANALARPRHGRYAVTERHPRAISSPRSGNDDAHARRQRSRRTLQFRGTLKVSLRAALVRGQAKLGIGVRASDFCRVDRDVRSLIE